MSREQLVWNVASYALGILSMAMLVGVVEHQSPPVFEEAIRDASQRKELSPAQLEEIGYWKRHERNQRECRGQTWIEQCCTDARPDLTCLNPQDIR
jgi:hypothetical protein